MEEEPSPPSHYHLLRRLLSLTYTSSPKTSAFYSQILYDLYNSDCLRGVELLVPVGVENGESSEQDDEREEGFDLATRMGLTAGGSPVKRRNDGEIKSARNLHTSKGKGKAQHQLQPHSASPTLTQPLPLPSHLALHTRAYTHLNASPSEAYSAIHLVKERIIKGFKRSDKEGGWRWNAGMGKIERFKNWTTGAGSLEAGGRVKKEEGVEELGDLQIDEEVENDFEEEQEVDAMDLDLPSTSTPKPKSNPKTPKDHQEEQDQDRAEYLPCLECAMIHARACEELKRFEEGRMVLERTVKSLKRMLSVEEFNQTISLPSTPIPLNPLPPLLQLAHLYNKSNTSKLLALKKEDRSDSDHVGDGDGEGEGEEYWTASKWFEDVLEGKGGGWCWEAWEGICGMGVPLSKIQQPFPDPTTSLPLPSFPSSLLPAPPALQTHSQTPTTLNDLLNSFSATSIESISGSQGPHSTATELARQMSGQSSTGGGGGGGEDDESPGTESAGDSTGAKKDPVVVPRRKLSPLPQMSPAVKAAAAQGGYVAAGGGSSGSVGGGFFTPVVGGAGVGGVGTVGIGGMGAPLRGGLGRGGGRGMHRAASPVEDISFPDVSLYGTRSSNPDSLVLPGMRSPTDGLPSTSTSATRYGMPSISSQLFPQAAAVSSSTFGIGETPKATTAAGNSKELYEPGIGRPPVAKRPRSAMERREPVGGGRNATGRNVSGKMLGEPPALRATRRSARLIGAKPGEDLESSKDAEEPKISATAIRHPPSSPPTSSDVPSSPPKAPEKPQISLAEANRNLQIQLQHTADSWLMSLVRRCAAVYHHYGRYDYQKTIELLDTLPVRLRRGTWALAIYGRSYYEAAEYEIARSAYAELRRLEPYRLKDMEWFSTVLWHLDDRAELSQLAQDLMAISRNAPQTWIAAGNCFALQGEHDEAIRCFKRASAVAPGMAYTYTLTAYEALEMEEYDRAIAYYQAGIRTDVRHYHAWFGLGRVYQKTGKLRMAEFHFRRALAINPSNVVLFCCVGTVVEKRGDLKTALDVFDRALQLAPKNKMARFRKARALMGLNRLQEALPILQALARESSSEASVVFLLGKLYRLLGNKTSSTKMFTRARDLNPKLAAVTEALSRGDGGGEDEDSEGEGDPDVSRAVVRDNL